MIRKTKKCKTCGEDTYIFSHGECKRCWAIGNNKKQMEKQADIRNADSRFYEAIWRSRPHFCVECGKPLPELRKLFMHHLLPKYKYPELRYEPDNVALVCGDCHSQAERDLDKTPKIKELTEQAKTKFL